MKLLDHCLRTGELMEITDTEEPVCPKCGLPLEGAKECIYCTGKGKTMVKLIKRIAPYKKYFAIAVICTILSELIWVLAPYLDRVIITSMLPRKHPLGRPCRSYHHYRHPTAFGRSFEFST